MFFLHGAPLFWTYYLLTVLSVAVFGVGIMCLTRPVMVLAAYRRLWEQGRQFWRVPAISDESETKLVGVMAVLLAVIVAYATFLY
jgi:hypothetical protein